MFESDLLRSFVAVAESGGFTRAAQALNSTQSTVSAQIRRLEEQAGQPLFARSTRSVRLTVAGEILLGYARSILRLNEDARLKLSGARQTGRVRLGVSEDLAAVWLPRILWQFASLYPGLQVDLEIGIGPRLFRMLDQRELDLVVGGRCDARPDDEPGDEPEGGPLWREPMVWAFAKDKALMHPPQLAFFPEPCPYREAAMRALAATEQPWRIGCTSSSLAGVRAAVLGGVAATPLPKSLVGAGLRVLADDEGLPSLPDVEYRVKTGSGAPSPAILALVQVIQSSPGLSSRAA
jgi:DNA-binding transcriptional LysR family regulator